MKNRYSELHPTSGADQSFVPSAIGKAHYQGQSGTITGRLEADPKASCNRDGSKRYYLQVAPLGSPGEPLPEGAVCLQAYVPHQKKDRYASLRRGDLVTVDYVEQTDTWLDSRGCPMCQTYLKCRYIRRYRELQRGQRGCPTENLPPSLPHRNP